MAHTDAANPLEAAEQPSYRQQRGIWEIRPNSTPLPSGPPTRLNPLDPARS